MLWFILILGKLMCSLCGANADRPGFITIDCGNEVAVTPQADLPDAGNDMQLPSEKVENLKSFYKTVRSFPYGKRNCYTLKPIEGKNNRYLIRVRFMYGNYDSKNQNPAFEVYVGGNLWMKVDITSPDTRLFHEMIYKPTTDFVPVCLVNIDQGTPFISLLELRPLNKDIYNASSSLDFTRRYDTGSETTTTFGDYYRNGDDEYDRLWAPLINKEFNKTWKIESTSTPLRSVKEDVYKVPKSIFQTRAMPKSGDSSGINFNDLVDRSDYYFYWHFADTETYDREFNMQLNNFKLGPFTLPYLEEKTISLITPLNLQERETTIEFFIMKTNASKYPPILNAVELYRDLKFSQPVTYQDDVDTVMDIKNSYKNTSIKGWQGDPCLPIVPWDGLICSNTTDVPPRITSLNLTSKGLAGIILRSISNLTSLTYLNLSNNSLTGEIPEFLAEMQSLKIIDLGGNNLSGSIPVKLMDKQKSGSLSLRLDGNPELCTSKTCLKKGKKKMWATLIACAVILCLLVALAVLVAYKWERKLKTAFGSQLKPKNRRFSHSELVTITNNFSTTLGEGGFGTVYLGSLKDGTNVAIKMLKKPSGLKSFQTEAELLMRVHHKNLVSLVGYCDEGKTPSLIYEYMAKGDVNNHLSAKQTNSSSWVERLVISCDAAQGLEYLHTGCTPTIIHRDIKTANILLDSNLRAKVADLGMSRIFANEDASDQVTADYVAGTIGYLDPEYQNTCKLNEKSDVYSFGVVLMELITGRPVIIKRKNDNRHVNITTWVKPFIDRAEIHRIVDPRFDGNFNENSAWKAVEIAMACVSSTGIQRPTMTEVLSELKECLILEEKAKKEGEHHTRLLPTSSSSGAFDIIHVDSEVSMGPSAR